MCAELRINKITIESTLKQVEDQRKMRKFCAKFPELKDIARFYVKFRRIIRDGERLEKMRIGYGEEKFSRRLGRLEKQKNFCYRENNRYDCLV